MKRYKVLAVFIIIIGIIIISKSQQLNDLYKGTSFLNRGINQDEKLKSDNPNQKKFLICIDPGHQSKGDSNPEPVAPGSGQQKARVSSGATGVATKKPEYI